MIIPLAAVMSRGRRPPLPTMFGPLLERWPATAVVVPLLLIAATAMRLVHGTTAAAAGSTSAAGVLRRLMLATHESGIAGSLNSVD